MPTQEQIDSLIGGYTDLKTYFERQRDDLDLVKGEYAALAGDLRGVVATELSQVLYVDNTLAQAVGNTFPTIKEAVDSLPAGGDATIRLNCGQTHDVDADIDMKRRGIILAQQGDIGLGKPIINLLAYNSGGYNRVSGFSGTGFSLMTTSCDIALPTVEPVPGDPWYTFDRTMCQHTRGGHRWLTLSSANVTGGVAGAGLGLISAYEASFAGLGLFVVSFDGPITGVIDGAGGVFHIRKVSATLQNGAALNSGGKLGANFLQN